ncbi:MAG: hypothetical protein A2W09_03785 [Deltaproteobacteria bacterium RBG_16_50_11]|nr:MAG: hypothetical protein A2W09_03785 [Deltaproteobacteria bacterium RBG_16_50_11]
MIQYEISVQDEWAAVTRFDTSHDSVHRDLISPDGKVTKRWYLQLSFDEGLTFAYNDIERNWEKYRDWYLSRTKIEGTRE